MKHILFVLVVVASSTAMSRPNSNLQHDLEDIVATIPMSDIGSIVRKNVEKDGEFLKVLKYMQGDELSHLVDTVSNNPIWQAFKLYMEGVGINIDGVIQHLFDLIVSIDIPRNSKVREFSDEDLQIVDLSATLTCLIEKLSASPSFQDFLKKITSDKVRVMVAKIRALDEVQRIVEDFRQIGIDFGKVIDLIYGLLGWTRKIVNRDYRSEIQNAILSKSAINYINTENATEFLEILKYLQGNEFKSFLERSNLLQRWKFCIHLWVINFCIGS
nr:protein G12-like [Onthophagus taurus]XP_022907096.1 protein G12-like [Onthophagus taurus]